MILKIKFMKHSAEYFMHALLQTLVNLKSTVNPVIIFGNKIIQNLKIIHNSVVTSNLYFKMKSLAAYDHFLLLL